MFTIHRERNEAARYREYANQLSASGRTDAATVMHQASSNLSTYGRLSKVSDECGRRYAKACFGEVHWRRIIEGGEWDDLAVLLSVIVEGMWKQYAGLSDCARR